MSEIVKLDFMPNQMEIRALSWKEPFASLMLHGKIETRTWSTNYRGWVLICASKIPYSFNQVTNITGIQQRGRVHDMLYGKDKEIRDRCGHAIAIGRLVDCRPMREADADKCFVRYNKGLFCHVYEDVQAIKPFPWVGSQGWGKVSDDIKRAIVVL